MDFAVIPLLQENLGLVYDKVLIPLALVTKVCKKCWRAKELEEFHPCKTNLDKRQGVCKECWRKNVRETGRERRLEKKTLALEEKERIGAAGLKICLRCREVKKLEEFYDCKAAIDGRRGTCRECQSELHKKSMQKPEVKARANEHRKKRLANDLNFKIAANLRSRVSQASKRGTKAGSAVDDLCCSIEEFKGYIAKKFKLGWTWDNRGRYTWHLDHITPLSAFDLTNREQCRQAFHYTNYQPLGWEENLKKGDDF